MSKILFSALIMPLALLTTACAPNGSTTKSTGNDQVNEFVINNLTVNKWCQKNQTSGAIDFLWTFKRDNTALVNEAATQNQDTYFWTINNDNLLTVRSQKNGPTLFTKKVSYGYDVNAHKRSMRWIDPQAQTTCDSQGVCGISSTDITSFSECD